jgi:hypothetical protein
MHRDLHPKCLWAQMHPPNQCELFNAMVASCPAVPSVRRAIDGLAQLVCRLRRYRGIDIEIHKNESSCVWTAQRSS